MKIIASLFCAALALASAAVPAQSWPNKTVRLIVSTGGGTSPDRIGRIVAERLTRDWGQSVVVDNMTGAGGLIASRTAVRAAPDGNTLFFAGVGALVTDIFTVKDLGYDPDRDFELISMIYEEGSLAIAVHPAVPAKSFTELFALAKKEPGKLSYGTTSVNFIILFGRWINKLAGTDMLGVAYKSPAQQFQDVLANRIQMVITSPPTIEPHLQAGKLRVLAIDGARRYPLWPAVPNIAETFPGFRLSGVGVLVAPRGTPSDVIRSAHRGMEKIVNDKTYQDALLTMGFTIDGAGSNESIRKLIRERRDYWKQVFDGLGVKPE
ncbi:MAG: tripartite tricarboxylate transporter substrate binding protein [Betaproteobacteria bacterium]|nr:tripartite tricarboxylate transporter substrate binding protein [Betaproteobacteria bacterium]